MSVCVCVCVCVCVLIKVMSPVRLANLLICVEISELTWVWL